MKYYVRLFLSVFLSFLLFSCAAIRTIGGKDHTAMEDSLASGRRKGDYKIKTEKMEVGRRKRQPIKIVAKEEIGLKKKGETEKSTPLAVKATEDGVDTVKEEKNRSVFKPYIPPERQTRLVEALPDEMPAEVKEQIISSGEFSPEEYVTLNFEQAPIDEIINTVSETLGMNYILAPGVKGQITMQTSKPVPISELFQILQSVLQVNGFTLVLSGRYFKVVQAKEAIHYPLEVMAGKGAEELPQEDTYVTQIISLDYIPVKEMLNVLKPFLSKSAPQPIQHDELNLLILNDTASNMKRLLKFVQELDKPLYQPKEKVFVYYVENGDSKNLAKVLNEIYKKGTKKKNDKRKFPTPQPGVPPQVIRQPFLPPFFAAGEEVEGDVTIVAAEDINALIITTSPRNYPAVLETIKKLDIQPRQVLVEVLIAEIKIDDSKEFGLDWSFGASASGGSKYRIGQDLGGGINTISQSSISSINWVKDKPGLNYMLSKQEKLYALLNAKVAENKFNLLSSPHIMASDNQEAKIEITEDYPIPKDSFDANNNKTTSYEYKSAGITLSFTPKINEKGLVSMKLTQEVSQGIPTKLNNLDTFTFNTRKAETSVVVHDAETLIIGGLVKEQKIKNKNGIPFLMDIPLLGYLFSHVSDAIRKTELIILITPHVVKNEQEGRNLTQQFQNRVKVLKNKIKQKDLSYTKN